jgi:hypothetical protein
MTVLERAALLAPRPWRDEERIAVLSWLAAEAFKIVAHHQYPSLSFVALSRRRDSSFSLTSLQPLPGDQPKPERLNVEMLRRNVARRMNATRARFT